MESKDVEGGFLEAISCFGLRSAVLLTLAAHISTLMISYSSVMAASVEGGQCNQATWLQTGISGVFGAINVSRVGLHVNGKAQMDNC